MPSKSAVRKGWKILILPSCDGDAHTVACLFPASWPDGAAKDKAYAISQRVDALDAKADLGLDDWWGEYERRMKRAGFVFPEFVRGHPWD